MINAGNKNSNDPIRNIYSFMWMAISRSCKKHLSAEYAYFVGEKEALVYIIDF